MLEKALEEHRQQQPAAVDRPFRPNEVSPSQEVPQARVVHERRLSHDREALGAPQHHLGARSRVR